MPEHQQTEENTTMPTATAERPRTGAAPAPRTPRLNEKRKFVAADKARLTLVMRKFKSGFLTYALHKPAGPDSLREQGKVTLHDTENQARTEYDSLARTAIVDGWKEKTTIPESAFDELPRPAVAAPTARTPRATGTAAGGRRR